MFWLHMIMVDFRGICICLGMQKRADKRANINRISFEPVPLIGVERPEPVLTCQYVWNSQLQTVEDYNLNS